MNEQDYLENISGISKMMNEVKLSSSKISNEIDQDFDFEIYDL